VSIELLTSPDRITVVGNITTGAIIAQGALADPWARLNVRA
jgi:hypothetical protein